MKGFESSFWILEGSKNEPAKNELIIVLALWQSHSLVSSNQLG